VTSAPSPLNGSVSVGLKFDGEKLRYDLIDDAAHRDMVEVITFGAKKYAPNNWRLLEDWQGRYYAALQRHLLAWRLGEIACPESRLRHLAHAACNVHFLQALDRHRL
jgi:hypothetical protein